MFTAGQSVGGSWQGSALFILETLAALAVIALAAWALVRFGGAPLFRRRGAGRLRVIERLVLEPKRSVYLIEADGRHLLVGVGEGSVRLLMELGQGDGPAVTEAPIDAREDR